MVPEPYQDCPSHEGEGQKGTLSRLQSYPSDSLGGSQGGVPPPSRLEYKHIRLTPKEGQAWMTLGCAP